MSHSVIRGRLLCFDFVWGVEIIFDVCINGGGLE